jgi:hypothetical protein
MIDPNYPDLTALACVPFMYHSTITGKYIEERSCFGIRLDTNYYFSIMDYLGETNEIRKWLDNNYKERLANVKTEEH